MPSPKGAAFLRHLQPRPQVLTHYKLPLACHCKWKGKFAPWAKERGGAPTRGIPGPDDMAPCSWQIKYLNNKAEPRLTVHLDNGGLRSTVPHSLKRALTEYIFSSPIPFKKKSGQSVVCAHVAELQDFKPQTCCRDSCLSSPVSGVLARGKTLSGL